MKYNILSWVLLIGLWVIAPYAYAADSDGDGISDEAEAFY